MKPKLLPYSNFPPDFQKETVSRALEIINQGECLQLIGLPGSGKSLLLRSLNSSNTLRFCYLDCNLMPEKTTSSILNFILSRLENKPEDIAKLEVIHKKLEKLVSVYLSDSNNKLILVFDAFDNLIDSSLLPLFKILKGLHDQKHSSLIFLFSVDREITNPQTLSVFGEFGSLVFENLLFLSPLNKKDTFLIVQETEKQLGKKVSPENKEKIYQLSGGFIRTIKCLAKAIIGGQTIESLTLSPNLNIHLNYHFEQLLEALKPETEILKNLVMNKTNSSDQKNLQTLINLSVIKPDKTFSLPLFFNFLKNKFQETPTFSESLMDIIHLKNNLTSSEYKALIYLFNHQDKICTREDLISSIWGENASLETSDHALDQLIHRLKSKLKTSTPPVMLETIRGRGHRFSFVSLTETPST